MRFPIRQLLQEEFPQALREIPQPPKTLFIRGELPKDRIFITVVGSRKASAYGKEATKKIIQDLAAYPFAIVSGLALGIDGIAHEEAVRAGLPTIGMPGSGLNPDSIYPSSHARLSEKILEHGGALVSEFPPDARAQKYFFPQRNRLMAGISSGTLVIEAREKSGTLITARLALDYNRLVFAVPGSVFSQGSAGPHTLIKEGAIPVTEGRDILSALNIEPREENVTASRFLSHDEKMLLYILTEPMIKEDLMRALSWDIKKLNSTLTSLEIAGIIKDEGGTVTALS